jgi:signal transduction histidine kinase/DNA-binding response OmpR family regulator
MKTINRHYVSIFLILLTFMKNDGYSQAINLSSGQKLPYNITSSIGVFRDSTAKLSLEQIGTKKFEKFNKDYFIFPFSDDIFWVKFTLKNTDYQNKDWFLVWTNPLAEQLDFYISDSLSNTFSHKQQKILTNKKDKKFIYEDPKFSIDLAPEQTKIIYIKLTTKRGHYGTLMLYSPEAFQKFKGDEYTRQGFLNGLLFFRLFLVLTLSFFVIKDLAFRLYSLYALQRTFTYLGLVNIAGPLFTDFPDLAQKIDFLCTNSVTLGAGLFILFAVITNKLPKWHSYIIYFTLFFTVSINVIIFFDYQWYWLKAGVYMIIFSSFYYIILYVYCIVKLDSLAKYYAIPVILGLISAFLIYVRLLGWIEYEALFTFVNAFFFGEVFVLIFFLGKIFNDSQQNKALTEQQLQFNLAQNTRLKELDNLKTKFFTNISHEFRTPLTLLVGPIDDLQQKYPQEGIIAVMQRNLQRLQNLINQLLDISKLEAGEMKLNLKEADIPQFLDHLFTSFESLAQGKKIIFNHSQSHTQQLGMFDLDTLEKIITNLLSNAFKFTLENGRINVRVEYAEKQISVKVQDYGIGISPERLTHIFDRFFQGDDTNQHPQEGTGIGLALVKELVDLLNGQIYVKSKVGEGTIFTLTFPFKSISETTTPLGQFVGKNHPDTLFIESDQVEQPTIVEDGQRIMLIVEDNPDLRNYMASIFENQYQLVMAIDGEDGLAKAIEFIPDIVISDLMMPKMDGLGFCSALKNDERINHIPVILLTAKASMADKLIGLGKGADDYLSKPFNKAELTVRVENLVNQRQLLREKYRNQTVEFLPEITVITEPTMNELFIQKSQKIIDKYLDNSAFDVDTFANEMNLSSVQLRRKLRAITDETVTEFVRNYRLEIASNMLKKGEGTVSEIAYKVGFESMPYFSKVFQEKYGKMASEWK